MSRGESSPTDPSTVTEAPGQSDRIATTVAALALGLAGFFAIAAWLSVLATALGVDPMASTPLAVTVSTLAGGLGTGSVAGLYLLSNRKPISYLDFERPTLRLFAVVILAVASLVVLNLGLDWVFSQLGAGATQHALLRRARRDPTILLVMLPLAYLVIAPGEELLYRNVVQKALYRVYSRHAAVVLASAIFAVAHFASYLDPDAPLATLNGLVIVFVLSLVLGSVYERTENLLASILVHGTFDAVAFAVAYVRLVG